MSQTQVIMCPQCGETNIARIQQGSRGLCRPCYIQQIATTCDADGCDKMSVGRYCQKHRRQLRLYGTLNPLRFARLNYCEVKYCYKLNSSYGLCAYHAEKKKLYGDAQHVRQIQIICSFCGDYVKVSSTGVVPDVCKPCSTRLDHVRRTYGLTPENYKTLLITQDYRCAICYRFLELHGSSLTRPVVDHCHDSEKVRGLLCGKCNTGIGHLNDDMAIAQQAANYLLITQHHNPLDPGVVILRTGNPKKRERKCP